MLNNMLYNIIIIKRNTLLVCFMNQRVIYSQKGESGFDAPNW